MRSYPVSRIDLYVPRAKVKEPSKPLHLYDLFMHRIVIFHALISLEVCGHKPVVLMKPEGCIQARRDGASLCLPMLLYSSRCLHSGQMCDKCITGVMLPVYTAVDTLRDRTYCSHGAPIFSHLCTDVLHCGCCDKSADFALLHRLLQQL